MYVVGTNSFVKVQICSYNQPMKVKRLIIELLIVTVVVLLVWFGMDILLTPP